MISPIGNILNSAWAYQLYQWLAGANKYKRFFADKYIRYEGGQKILDIGCGPADMLEFLPRNTEYTGIDSSPDYIAKAKIRYPGVKLICGDITNPLFYLEDCSFDTVFLIGVLHHCSDEETYKMLMYAFRKMKKGGRLLSLEPVYTGNQNKLELSIMKYDRGKFIRNITDYQKHISKVFLNCRYEVFTNTMNIPFTIIITTGEK